MALVPSPTLQNDRSIAEACGEVEIGGTASLSRQSLPLSGHHLTTASSLATLAHLSFGRKEIRPLELMTLHQGTPSLALTLPRANPTCRLHNEGVTSVTDKYFRWRVPSTPSDAAGGIPNPNPHRCSPVVVHAHGPRDRPVGRQLILWNQLCHSADLVEEDFLFGLLP